MFSLRTLSQIAGLLPPRAYQPLHQAGHFAAAAVLPVVHGVWMRGLLRESGKPAQLLVAGEPPWMNYLPQRLLRPGFQVEPIFRARVPMVPRLLDRYGQQADLVCLRMDHGWARLTLGPDYLRVPEWLGAFIDLPEDLESFLHANESRYSDVRRLRREGFTWQVSNLAQDLETLYRDFHVPFIQRRFGAHAHVAHPWLWQRQLAHGGVLWVLHKGRRVAGLFFTLEGKREGKSLRLFATGSAGDAEAKAGFAGLYAFSCTHAHALGLRSLNLGGCRPTLRDGVFRYKRKWGARFVIKTDQYFDLYLRWHRPSLALDELLRHTPLVIRDGAGLSQLAALPDHDADRALALTNDLRTLGLRRTILLGRSSAALPSEVALFEPRSAQSSHALVQALATR